MPLEKNLTLLGDETIAAEITAEDQALIERLALRPSEASEAMQKHKHQSCRLLEGQLVPILGSDAFEARFVRLSENRTRSRPLRRRPRTPGIAQPRPPVELNECRREVALAGAGGSASAAEEAVAADMRGCY